MNRLEHLKKTLDANIRDNKDHERIEFILLDYSSSDGLEEYVKHNFRKEIEQGILRFYQYKEAAYFNRSHSSNLSFKLATGDLLCKLDADNYTGEGFATFINKAFTEQENIFLTPLGYTTDHSKRDVLGRIVVKRTDFFNVGGFDERMINYGFEDYDLVYRLEMTGLTRRVINDKNYLKAIQHSKYFRVSNEFMWKNLQHLFIRFITPSSTEFLFLLKDQCFEKLILINNKTLHSHLPFQPVNTSYGVSIENDVIETGIWFVNNNSFELQSNSATANDPQKISLTINRDEYFEVQNKEMLLEAICIHSEQTNRITMEKNLQERSINNGKEWGAGMVFKNFDDNTAIVI